MENIVEKKIYNYTDYINSCENERIEVIDGYVYNMSPSPSRIHQKIITELCTILNFHIKSNNGSCEVYVAPFDIMLIDDNDINKCTNIVQPDISVICDKSKLNDKGCIGAPDLILEVVSPHNPSNDYVRKLNLYEKYKVSEYWIVNPINKTILVYILDNNMLYSAPEAYTFKDIIKVGIYENFEIDFSQLAL